MKKITVAVSCYHNEEEIKRFAKQLEKQTVHESITLLVTMNAASSNASQSLLVSDLDRLDLETVVSDPGSNLGYLHGAVYSLDKAGISAETEWIVICNTDIEFASDSFFEQCLALPTGESVWAVAPLVHLKEENINQNPFMEKRPSNEWICQRKRVYSNPLLFTAFLLLAVLKNKHAGKEMVRGVPHTIYAQHGCFFILKPGFVRQLINDQNDVFMFGEELLLAELIRQAGRQIYYYPELEITHLHTRKAFSFNNRFKQKCFKQSFNYLYSRFFSE